MLDQKHEDQRILEMTLLALEALGHFPPDDIVMATLSHPPPGYLLSIVM